MSNLLAVVSIVFERLRGNECNKFSQPFYTCNKKIKWDPSEIKKKSGGLELSSPLFFMDIPIKDGGRLLAQRQEVPWCVRV
jgi:hypothetical protein